MKLSKHPSPPTPPHFLLDVQPDAIPWTDELESRLDVLLKLKAKHSERVRLAKDNVRAILEEFTRIRNREKVKRERECK